MRRDLDLAASGVGIGLMVGVVLEGTGALVWVAISVITGHALGPLLARWIRHERELYRRAVGRRR